MPALLGRAKTYLKYATCPCGAALTMPHSQLANLRHASVIERKCFRCGKRWEVLVSISYHEDPNDRREIIISHVLYKFEMMERRS